MFRAPQLDSDERAVRDAIEELNIELRLHMRHPSRWTGALRRTTLARNIQGSNSIEGIHASVDDVSAIAAGDHSPTVDAQTERALAGYQQAMTYVLQLAKSDFNIDASLIRSLHFMVGSYDLTKWPGRFREGPVYVLQEATGDIVHEGAPSDQLVPLINEFAAHVMSEHDPLIAAAMAHLNFVLIHPFKDGNGRMARVLQSLVLARESEFSPVFMTIEEHLGRHTQAYYDVLAKVGQGTWATADHSAKIAKPWIRFMLSAHFNQALERKQRIAAAGEAAAKMDQLALSAALPTRATEALYSVMFGGTITRARYMSALAEADEPVSEQTASRDLLALVRANLLVPHGDKRGRRYAPAPPVVSAARTAGLGWVWRHLDPFAT